MKKDYFKNIPRQKELIQQAYDSYRDPIHKQLQRLKQDYSVANLMVLEKLIQCQNSCKTILEQHKVPIFRYILQQQLKNRTFIHTRSTVALRLLNLTKFKIKNLRLNWLQVYQTLTQQQKQIARSKSSNLQQFLKILRPFYDPNNAMDVVKKFAYGQAVSQDNTYTFIELFTLVSSDTTHQVFEQYLSWIMQSYNRKYIQAGMFFILFINAVNKRKQVDIDQAYYKIFNIIVLTAMTNPSIKSGNNDSRFSKDNGAIIYFLVGKNNPFCLQLLDKVFKIINKNIFPFENSTRALRFFYSLIRWFWKRIQSQKHTKRKLDKLIQKQQKKLNEQDQKVDKNQDQQDDQEDGLQQQEENQQINQQNLAKQLLSIEQDEGANDDNEIKKQKYQRILKRQITEDIIALLKKHVVQMFQNCYFVNSKKTVPQLLRYFFMFFPQLCEKSLDLMDKAGNIQDINDEAIVSNVKITIQYLFTKGYEVYAIKNVNRIIQKMYQVRKITQVWGVYEIIYSKVPLLDEKDMKQISQSQKQVFLNKFGINHDSFYETYSQNVFEAYKRLLREGQYFDDNARRTHGQSLSDLIYNSHVNFRNRLIEQSIEVIMDNANQFSFIPIEIYNRPISKKLQQILQNQLESIKNSEKEEVLLIQQCLVNSLMNVKSIKQLSPYIRFLAKKNKFDLIHDYMRIKVTLDFDIAPLSSSLDYFEKDPKFSLSEVKTLSKKQESIKELHEYFKQLFQQLKSLLDEPDLKEGFMQQNLLKIYKNEESVKIIEKRKTIYQILKILSKMTRNFEHLLYVYDNGLLKLVQPQIPPPNVYSEQFLNIIKKIVYNSEMMQDPKIPSVVTQILCAPINKYAQKVKNQKQIQKRAHAQNQHRQLPQNKNVKYFIYAYISKIKVCQSSILLNQTRTQNNLNSIKQIMMMLMVAPLNQKLTSIISSIILQNKLNDYSEEIVNLFKYSNKLENKFYQSKLAQIFEIVKLNGIIFNSTQSVSLLDSHMNLVMHQDNKIREAVLKSLRNLIKILQEIDAHDAQSVIKIEMQKYLTKQKLQSMWIYSMYLLIYQKDKSDWNGISCYQLVDGVIQQVDKKKKEHKPSLLIQRVKEHVENFQKLILSDQSRVIRRIAMFIYAAYHRKIKKQYSFYEKLPIKDLKYQQKSIQEFLRTGYLYPQHYDKDIKNKDSKRSGGPYYQIQIKKHVNFPDQTYNFLIKSEENSIKFLKNFHADMAATPQQLQSSLLAIKALDLNDILSRLMEETYNFMKLKTFQNSKVELIFGSRFFKYLFIQDSMNEYKFFKISKQFMYDCLKNIESLDNQGALLIYTGNLILCYIKKFCVHGQNKEIQDFVENVMKQFAQKSAGSVYKKFVQLLFSNIRDEKPVNFLIRLCDQMILNRQKISRYAELLLTIKRFDRQRHMEILKILLDEKIQLEHSYLSKLLGTIITISQKIPIDIQKIKQTSILNVQKLAQQGKVFKFSENTYIIGKKQFQDYVLAKINEYINSGAIELIKSAYNIVNSLISSYCKTLQTKENLEMINKLMRIGFKLINIKGQFQIDHKIFELSMKNIFGQPYKEDNFVQMLNVVMEEMEPTKKSCQIIEVISWRPRNFFSINEQIYITFIKKIAKLQENSIIFKQVLVILTNLIGNRQIQVEKMELQKSQKVLLYQAYLLGTGKIDKQKIEFILKSSTKEKRNIWAKQMLLVRGKKQFLDNEEQYQIWRQIKSVSNPYNYHA